MDSVSSSAVVVIGDPAGDRLRDLTAGGGGGEGLDLFPAEAAAADVVGITYGENLCAGDTEGKIGLGEARVVAVVGEDRGDDPEEGGEVLEEEDVAGGVPDA